MGTNSIEAAVCEAGTVDVLQTLCCAVQLLLLFSELCGGEGKTAHQLQPVGAVVLNVVHDAPVHHPLRHNDELSFLQIFPNPNKFQDVRVGQSLPEKDFHVKSLVMNG